ncbi:MAG: T9SS type A sorting domain-containing protein [Bacteroidaceae bacterium]|nr:T9SS type A sorting domain-containing protein [Prevotellaceae bacterium]MDD7527686.1 T9SS type A sorting domain-containing protein [Prevotellaceae bacterium]MDY5761135.1 T9SS type A sorting domain-containing protein [Bacteroidaceae bacterium]MDY6257179.1 T9SS type A sorting domain-containing protein [Bacteroidaceae bacterium]
MKKLTFSLLMLVASIGATAKSLVFTLNDGTKVYYQLSSEVNPIMRFKEGKLLVNDDVYEFDGIKNFYLSDEDAPNAIENVQSKPNVTFKANTVLIPADAVKVLKVFTVDGVEVKTVIQNEGDVFSVDLNGLAKGVYVISTGKSSLKVIKK